MDDAQDTRMNLFEAPPPAIDRGPPRLMVVVDTEEEFDWTKPFSRAETGVSHIRHLERGQKIFTRFGLRPTYLVDYPVASQSDAHGPLREWLADGRCDIGAHLHPWVNPPFDEQVSSRNSYPGNLPPALEREKLKQLTDAIETNFAHRPTIYRAGRYGIGPATGAILEELGYTVDTSVVPKTDFSEEAGPDFSACPLDPFWFGPSRRVLEIPLTVGWCGALERHEDRLRPLLTSRIGRRSRMTGAFARLGLLERIRLSPEGIALSELKRLTEDLIRRGKRLFGFTFHSPSLVPGRTPYVRTESDLRQFLDVIEGYCAYFFGECGGAPGSLEETRAIFAESRRQGVDAKAPAVAKGDKRRDVA